MAFCDACGARTADGDEFCGACGTSLGPAGAGAAPAGAPKRKLGLVVALAIVLAVLLGLGCCGAAAVFGARQLGFGIDRLGIEMPGSDDAPASEGRTAETAAAEADDETDGAAAAEGADAPEDAASGTLSMAESFDVLTAHYQRLWTLHERIGLKNDAKPRGGTGFAYDDFNRNIGAGGKPQRQALAKRCETLLEEVDAAEQELIDAPIDPAYADQQAKLLKLYGYLLARMRAMYAAAQIAVDSPTASAWRPALQPASGNAREAFEREYPKAKPTPL